MTMSFLKTSPETDQKIGPIQQLERAKLSASEKADHERAGFRKLKAKYSENKNSASPH